MNEGGKENFLITERVLESSKKKEKKIKRMVESEMEKGKII